MMSLFTMLSELGFFMPILANETRPTHDLMILLALSAINVAGMLVIYAALSYALARFAERRRGVFAIVLLIILSQLFWLVPTITVPPASGLGLSFVNWIVCGFSLALLGKSVSRIPAGLSDAARLDGLGPFATWRNTVLPFVGRDLVVIAILTLMAAFAPMLGFEYFPDIVRVIFALLQPSLGERMSGLVVWIITSSIGAIPLIAIFFATNRPPDPAR